MSTWDENVARAVAQNRANLGLPPQAWPDWRQPGCPVCDGASPVGQPEAVLRAHIEHVVKPPGLYDVLAEAGATFDRESLGIAWDEGYSAAFHDTGYGDTKNPHAAVPEAGEPEPVSTWAGCVDCGQTPSRCDCPEWLAAKEADPGERTPLEEK